MFGKWLIKYKLYHIPFWCIYFALFLNPLEPKLLFYIPIQLAAVYFNLYILVPAWLEKGKLVSYILLLIATLALASAAVVAGYHTTAFLTQKTFAQLYGVDYCTYYFFGNAVPAVFACLTITLCIRLTKNRILTQRRQQVLEKEQLETELNFLKHQFNPHFLFNTINSIFFLIHKKPDTASESLARFSDLLRYQLYECNDKQIPLSKEISHLKNSIELERLRLNDNVRVTLCIDDQPTPHAASTGMITLASRAPSKLRLSSDPDLSSTPLGIAPFILMTFVENAFKHVSGDPGTPSWITIGLHLEQDLLNFCISNSVSTNSITPNTIGTAAHNSGIGLKNVRRRLDLLYPGRYDLNISSSDHSFDVRLRLELSTISIARTSPNPGVGLSNPGAGLSFLS